MKHSWGNVLEQERAKEILTNFFDSRRVPHAFIFFGPDGVGKFFTALQYSQMLYSYYSDEIRTTAQKKIQELQEPYVKLIFPLPRAKGESSDDSSIEKLSKEQIEIIQSELSKKINNPYYKISIEDANTIKINSIREIRKFANHSYEYAPLRFIFILDADLMNEQTQNALLKNLEEPPEGIVFFIITSNIEKLLPTVQSRCWTINFNPLSTNSVKDILIKYFEIDEITALRAAHFANGSVQNALILIKKDIAFLLEKVISILRYSIARRYFTAYQELISTFNGNPLEDLQIIINLIKVWFNDVLKNKFDSNDYNFKDFSETFIKFNSKYNVNINEIYSKLEKLEEGCKKNLNLNVLSMNLIFELASISIRK